MILGQLEEHDHVLVRSRVMTAFADSALLLIPARRGEFLEEIENGQMYRPPSTDALYLALQALQLESGQAAERLAGLIVRTIAETNELGGHALSAKSAHRQR